MAISLRQLGVFIAVTQERTITAAAERLFLSKPAVSMALSELEKQLGHRLFERFNNRLLINEQGKLLLPLADELLSRSGEIEQLFQSGGGLNGQIKMGASDTIGNQLAPYLLRDFRQQTGHLQQHLSVSNSRDISEKLLAFELDIGLIEGKVDNREHFSHPSLELKPWLSDEMCIACAPDHPLAKKKAVPLFELEGSNWVVREQGSGTREHFMSRLAPRLENWSISFELSNTEAIINCAAAGLGLAYLSKLSARHAVGDGRICLLEVPLDLRRQYWIAQHKDKHPTPLLDTFVRFCHQWEIER